MKAKSIIIAALLVGALQVSAQEALKIGWTQAEYILSLMPESKQIEADLKAYEKQLQNQLQAKYSNYEALVKDYQDNAATYDELIRADKEQEIATLQQSIQKFSQDAEVSLGNKRNTLLGPVFEKIGKAIEDVAKENGYTHIFSGGSPGLDILLYAREQDNVSDLVLKKLGITPPITE
ncbi:MAG: OmpH family outer membrane protein [Cyclobacteriaceae bacterium]